MPMTKGSTPITRPSSSAHSSTPLAANFAAGHFLLGGGVAIFHVASSRVVVCHHSRDGYWFLPKGRRDAGETSERAAEREGFEESGYRNRLLPLPLHHYQPQPHIPRAQRPNTFTTEPVFMQLYPQNRSIQYLCFWYVAECVPPAVEDALNAAEAEAEVGDTGVLCRLRYQYPPEYPHGLTLRERAAMEPEGWEPKKHEGRGVDAEEALYESALLPIDEALEKLKWNEVAVFVIKTGWEAIKRRITLEG